MQDRGEGGEVKGDCLRLRHVCLAIHEPSVAEQHGLPARGSCQIGESLLHRDLQLQQVLLEHKGRVLVVRQPVATREERVRVRVRAGGGAGS